MGRKFDSRTDHVVDIHDGVTGVPVVRYHPPGCDVETCPVIDVLVTAIVEHAAMPRQEGRYRGVIRDDGRLDLTTRIGAIPYGR